MKKSQKELSIDKLRRAKTLFETLATMLEKGEHPPKHTQLGKLEISAKEYATAQEGAMYDACVRLYRTFHVSKNRNPWFTQQLKIMLRQIVNRFFRTVPHITDTQLSMF